MAYPGFAGLLSHNGITRLLIGVLIVSRAGLYAQPDATAVTDHYLRGLATTDAAMEIVVNNEVVVDTSLRLPENISLTIGPSGSLIVLPEVIFEARGPYTAAADHAHLTGEGWVRLPNTEVYPDWFGARPNASYDSRYELTRDAVVSNAHYLRKALFAAGSYGRIRFGQRGTYEIQDDALLRKAFARNFGARDFKPARAALDLNPRLEGAAADTFNFDGVQVRGQGKAETVLACPNDDDRCAGFSASVYRRGGWSEMPDSVITFDTVVEAGQRWLRPRTAAGLALARNMDRVMVVNGANYYEQEQGQMNRGARVTGDRVEFDYPFEKDMGLEAVSFHGRTLESFTAPPEGETVQIRTEKKVGGGKWDIFSLENDLYARVSSDGGDRYTVRSLPGHGNAVGKVFPAGTRTSRARVMVAMRATPADQVVEDIGLIGRYDGVRISNVMDLSFRRCLLVQAPRNDEGLTINGDGSLNVSFEDCTIIGGRGKPNPYGQLARSTTNMRFDRCLLHPLEVSEFTTHTQIYDSEMFLEGKTTESYVDRDVISVGASTGRTEIVRTHLRGSRLTGIIGSRDIQGYSATSGGGLLIRDVTVVGDSIRVLLNFGVAAVDIDGLHTSGSAYGWMSRLGSFPAPGSGSSDRDWQAEGMPVSRMRNATFTGRLGQVISGYLGAADAEFVIVRTGPYSPPRSQPGKNSRSRGTLVDKTGPEAPPYALRVKALIYGWSLGETRNPELQYPGLPTGDSYLRFDLKGAEIYNGKGESTGEIRDTLVCHGTGCTAATAGWTTGTVVPKAAVGNQRIRMTGGRPTVVLRTPAGGATGEERAWITDATEGDYQINWSGLVNPATYEILYALPPGN